MWTPGKCLSLVLLFCTFLLSSSNLNSKNQSQPSFWGMGPIVTSSFYSSYSLETKKAFTFTNFDPSFPNSFIHIYIQLYFYSSYYANIGNFFVFLFLSHFWLLIHKSQPTIQTEPFFCGMLPCAAMLQRSVHWYSSNCWHIYDYMSRKER